MAERAIANAAGNSSKWCTLQPHSFEAATYMSRLAKPIELQTAFNDYLLQTILGEGGAGRVYGGQIVGGGSVAIKVLTAASRDKRQRFKNEIAFLSKVRHQNLVAVTDAGMADGEIGRAPFYVMERYEGSLRTLMRDGVGADRVLGLFCKILDGVEAAHLFGVTHRDLKPENVLVSNGGDRVAIADFGIAAFTADQLVTYVETGPSQRLANFMYAAPEQRSPGTAVAAAADIYALGLLLNEMFTGSVPHGTSYQQIESVAPEYAFLDRLVAQMIAQTPNQRPENIQAVKAHIEKYKAELVSQQRLSALSQSVIKIDEIDDPLADEPPKVVDGSWEGGRLSMILDRDITSEWVRVLKYGLISRGGVLGHGPETFNFSGNGFRLVSTNAREHNVQAVIDAFKSWLPMATRQYRRELEHERARQNEERTREVERARAAEEQYLRVNKELRF